MQTTKHQWLVHMGTVILDTSKTVATEVEIFFFFNMNDVSIFVATVSVLKKGGCPSTLVHIVYVQVIGVWWLIFGSSSSFKVTPEVFSWDQDLAFCRPVKFFHTDWIIISHWSLLYTQRHCHVRIEKGPVQTVDIKLKAHNSLEYHYMLKH